MLRFFYALSYLQHFFSKASLSRIMLSQNASHFSTTLVILQHFFSKASLSRIMLSQNASHFAKIIKDTSFFVQAQTDVSFIIF